MQERDYYHPDSKEFYQASTPRESALLKIVLKRERILYSLTSQNDGGNFVERLYVKSKDGHHIQNECMIVDLELSEGRDKILLMEFEGLVQEVKQYYDHQLPV